ncbi:MAG: hypothetical protein CME88_02535 [Hirschia sp.]|nr:hypothetical protein [Hirschia sp.]MBF17240.1 hypothetical protein [Hirschia sp.]
MAGKTPSWGREIGYQSKIKTHNPNIPLGAHGLSGAKAEGKLSFNREKTKKVAKEDARDGIPVSTASTFDQWSEREQQIAAEAEDMRRGLTSWFAASSASVRNFIQDCTPAEIDPDILRESIKAEENEIRSYEIDDVQDARAEHEATVVELAAFKDTHGDQIGKRTPDIKKSIEQAIAILLFVMIIEGCFNALLFKDAQSNGLLGGLLVAFGVSAVNVGCGVIAGFFGLRYLNHPQIPFKVLGGITAGLFISFGLFLNLFVAHFRDTVERELHARMENGSLAGFSMFDIAPGSVIGGMFPNLVGLDSMVAFGLLFMGLAIFAVAVFEGYDKISDRYPGYGRVWRKERQAYEKRQEVRLSIREELAEYYTSSRSWFDSQVNRHAEAKREIEKAINWLDVRREEAQSTAAKVGDQERVLKVSYRQAHRRERNMFREELGENAEVPAYFDEIVTANLPQFDYTREREQADKAIQTLDLNMKALTITRQWLDTHIQTVQKGLASVEKKVEQILDESRGGQKGGQKLGDSTNARPTKALNTPPPRKTAQA